MKSRLPIGMLLSVCYCASMAQDIPLVNQKITNTFLYNPALTGFKVPSITYVYKKVYTNVSGAPETNLLSAQMPFRNSRFGTGVLICRDKVNFIQNTTIASAFAYHVAISEGASFSMGVSGELDHIGLVSNTNFSSTTPNPVFESLRQQSVRRYDFSFGVHLATPTIQAGFSANRLSASLIQSETEKFITDFYSVYAQLVFWNKNKTSKVEPFVSYRRLSNTGKFGELALYYTIRNKLTLGTHYKTFGAFGMVIGYNLRSSLGVTYSQEMYTNVPRGTLGPTHEVDLQYKFPAQEENPNEGYPIIEQTRKRYTSIDYRGTPTPRKVRTKKSRMSKGVIRRGPRH